MASTTICFGSVTWLTGGCTNTGFDLSEVRAGGSETSLGGALGCGVNEDRMRNEGREDNGGIDKSRVAENDRRISESEASMETSRSKELVSVIDLIAMSRENGRGIWGGSKDMVRGIVCR